MKRINVNALFPLIALILLIFALSQQMFYVAPPLGKVLDPFIGAVRNEFDPGFEEQRMLIEPTGVLDSVTIYFDDRRVPHIYAANEKDLYFAQGYVTARLRLWQMDFLSLAAAGRLAEVFGPSQLDHDRTQRRIGIPAAAEAALRKIESDPESIRALTAYTRGVNHYIKELDYTDLPFEYKVLDYEPIPWTNLRSVLLLKNLGNLLSGYEEDHMMTQLILTLGEEKFNELYPDFGPLNTPLVANVVSEKNPALTHVGIPDYLDHAFLSSKTVVSESPYNPNLGSNSWVVSGEKSISGSPILCSDPHLSLKLPSTWIEMQLSTPDLNVYGYSIPGTPAVIIGFNEDIAWALTNGQTDTKDWYKLKLTSDFKKYEYDGKWVELDQTVEEIKVKGRAPFYDTVYYSIHGPVPVSGDYRGPQPELLHHALKWGLHDPSNEFLTFLQLGRAGNWTEFERAIRHFQAPVQNFIYADKENNIGAKHQGRLLQKAPGAGRFILDGTSSGYVPKQPIPSDSLPVTYNPTSHYIVSANQHPTDLNYPYYYSGYFNEKRAARINEVLKGEVRFDADKMMELQLDNTSVFALEALQVLEEISDSLDLKVEDRELLNRLVSWNGSYGIENEEARLFELWWEQLESFTWDELQGFAFGARNPEDYLLLELITDQPNHVLFDLQGTTERESAIHIVGLALSKAMADYRKIEAGRRQWGDHHRVNLMHLIYLNPYSWRGVPSAGHPDAINAISGDWGPSLRLVVEMGEWPRAFGIYAGGQSGKVGSKHYDDLVEGWNKGSYCELKFFPAEKEAAASAQHVWVLR